MPRRPLRKWLSTNEVAERLEISPQQVRQFILQHKFKYAEQIGHAWSIPVTDVEKFVKEREKIGKPVGMRARILKERKADKCSNSKD